MNTNSGHRAAWFLKTRHHTDVELGMARDWKNTKRNQATEKIKMKAIQACTSAMTELPRPGTMQQ
jgi:hypothetical protein